MKRLWFLAPAAVVAVIVALSLWWEPGNRTPSLGPPPIVAQPLVTVAEFQEGVRVCWPVQFRDIDGTTPVTPSTAQYTIATFTGNTIVGWTEITGLASDMDLCVDGLAIPAEDKNTTNPNLPEKVTIFLNIDCVYGASRPCGGFQYDSLVRRPGYPPPTPTP